MRLIDLRDPNLPSPFTPGGDPDEGRSEERRSHLVLAPDATFRFTLDEGNMIPWHALEPMLATRLPMNGHDQLHDVGLGESGVVIDARCGSDVVRWICSELVTRGVIPPSMPVLLEHPGGYEEDIGPVGHAARHSFDTPVPA